MGNGGDKRDEFTCVRRFSDVESAAVKKSRLFLLAACLFPILRAEPETAAAPPEEAAQFIRVEEDAGTTELQTAVVKFTKGDAEVELVGAIHIGDREYYQGLNRRFEGYEAVLYEGIGGGRPAAPAAPADEKPGDLARQVPEGKPKANLSGLHGAYDAAARWLDLSYQMKEIDYRKANFVHADLSLEEFAALQAERKENILGFMLKSGLQAGKNPPKEPSSFKLLASIIRKEKNGLKRELVHTMSAGDDQVAGLAGDNVIIGDRNAKCLEVLDAEVAAGKKKLCIFYGAAHFPDMEKRLLEQGWSKTGTEWVTAWEIK